MTLTGGTNITNNTAGTSGGGVYVTSHLVNNVPYGSITYAGVTIGNNTATGCGDGVYRETAGRTDGNGSVTWAGGNTELEVP